MDTPLGKWIHFPKDTWQWYLSSDNEILYRYFDKEWSCYDKCLSSVRHKRFSVVDKEITNIPSRNDILPTTVRIDNSGIHCEGSSLSTTQIIHDETDSAYLAWLHCTTESSPNIDKLIDDITEGTAVGVSDGNYKSTSQLGTAAWRIESHDGSSYIQGTSIAPGLGRIQSPHRSELVGILAMMEKLTQLSTTHDIKVGHVTLACDGINALDTIRYKNIDKTSPNTKHSDIVSAIKKLRTILPFEVTAKHVKGHQDDLLDFDELDRLAQLNVMMDIDAKSLLEILEQNPSPHELHDNYPSHPHSMILPSVNEQQICETMSKTIYSMITDRAILEYWVEKERFCEDDIPKIDWDNQAKAMKLSPLSTRRFISKWASNWIGTGENMKKWNIRPHGYCPFCKNDNENTHHILKCLHEEATKINHDALWVWTESMIKIKTCPRAVRAIRDELYAWRNNTSLPTLDNTNETLTKAILSQRQIGWKSFIEGLLTLEWKQYQKEYFEETESLQSHNLWVSKAIRIGWKYLTTIWNGRNTQLHQIDHILDMEGRKEMIKAIHDEYNIGLGRLPAYGFSYMFKSPAGELAKSSMEKIKHWLSIIKQGRIVYEDPQRIEDDFFTKGALYKALDLHELNEYDFEQDE